MSRAKGSTRKTPATPARSKESVRQKAYVALARHFAKDPRVTPPTEARGKFGANGFKVNGKIFAMWVSESLVVKLPKSEVQLAVSQGRGRALEMGAGRVMKEWLVVDEPEESWPAIAEKALAFVSGDA